MYESYCNNIYSGGVVPPCAAFLSDTNPIIKDGKIIYRNLNRIFCFISTSPKPPSTQTQGERPNPSTFNFLPSTSTNLQISLTTFLIGLFINQVQLGYIKYENQIPIHPNKAVDEFIHEALQISPEVKIEYTPNLTFVYSNGNAILPLISSTQQITPLNYYILFILNRFENNPALLYGNNSFITRNPINFDLSALNQQFPI